MLEIPDEVEVRQELIQPEEQLRFGAKIKQEGKVGAKQVSEKKARGSRGSGRGPRHVVSILRVHSTAKVGTVSAKTSNICACMAIDEPNLSLREGGGE